VKSTLTLIYIVFNEVPIHMSRFGFYHARREIKNLERERHQTLFEALFEPYYNSPPRNNSEHLKDLNEVLDKAVNYGMTVLGHTSSVIEERWGGRANERITDTPGLYCLFFEGQKMVRSTKLLKSSYENWCVKTPVIDESGGYSLESGR
jgi:hypothetical protein